MGYRTFATPLLADLLEAVEYPATAGSQDHYQPTRVGGDSPHGLRRLRARYPIAYSHYNVPQTSNPQRRQTPEEVADTVYICAKRRLPDRGHRPRKDSVSSRLIADESLRDSGSGWISPKSTSKAVLEPEVVKRHISIERPAGYGRKPATRKSINSRAMPVQIFLPCARASLICVRLRWRYSRSVSIWYCLHRSRTRTPGLSERSTYQDSMSRNCSWTTSPWCSSEKLGHLLLVEVGVDQRPVQVQRGDELLRSRLLHVVDGLAEDVDDVPPAHGHDVVVVDHGVAVQRHAAAVGAGPEHDLGALALGLLPDLVEVGVEAGEDRDAAEIGIEDGHAVPAQVQTFAPDTRRPCGSGPAPCPSDPAAQPCCTAAHRLLVPGSGRRRTCGASGPAPPPHWRWGRGWSRQWCR